MEVNTKSNTLESKKENKKLISGAEAVIKCLIEESVNTIFGYPGGAIMPVYDALYHYQAQINHILVRHEQGAIHAAQGYARVSNKIGVCIATSGPGATNLITGIADARIDSTPVVCITGQVPYHLLGTDAFQETDIISISTPITKWAYQVTKASEIPEIIARAFYIAGSGRPGPVLIDITKNAQIEDLELFEYKKCDRIRSYHPYPDLNENKIDEAVELIDNAKKPFILVGQGVLLSNAEKELLQFAEKTGIPVASTLLGLSAISSDHPLYVGYLGMHGNYGPNIQTNKCDVLIAIGMRFDDRVTGNLEHYAKQAKVIHIEIDEAEISKNVFAHVPINGDAKDALTSLIRKCKPNSHVDWLESFNEFDEKENEIVIKDEIHPKGEGLKMAEVIHLISNKSKGEAILVTDVGQHQMVASRYYKFKNPLSNVTSGGLGTMGFALPAAIGAKLAMPNKTIICVVGDGGFQMNIQELGTIYQSNIDVKILVLNNEYLGMVRQWQQLFFDKRYSFTIMKNPNFQIIASGYSIPSQKVENRQHLDEAIDKWLYGKGPQLLEIMVEKEENVFPMVPSGASVSEIRLK